ncbi:hypothetical protein DL95DRAFT_387851 [Leptodontidium sp. 2 PMI_412]|nr:hypothetical protein DL95DRAFT_387851 [Leptodontidium sp. 2 PMI_412]
MHFQKILALAAMISFTYAMPRAIMARSPIESLAMDPAGHFEVRSDGTILSWDGLNNVIDSVKLSSVEFDELTARNPHLLRGDLQSVESPANNGMTPRGKPEDLFERAIYCKGCGSTFDCQIDIQVETCPVCFLFYIDQTKLCGSF